MPALGDHAHLGIVRAFIGDPAGIHRGHQDPIGVQHFLGAGAREHVQRGLGHIGVRVPGALVSAGKLALHGRDVHDVFAPRAAGGQCRAQARGQQEGRGDIAQLHFQHLQRVHVPQDLGPRVLGNHVGDQASGVDGSACGDPLQRCRPGFHGQVCQLLRVVAAQLCRGEQGRVFEPEGTGQGLGVLGRRVGFAPEFRAAVAGEQFAAQRLLLGFDQVLVGVGGAPHGLGRVVDQDVQRAFGGDAVGQGDDLGGVAQIDADNAQSVQPLAAVFDGGEAPGGVFGEARGDGGVRPVAQQPQGDMHADFCPSAGEQGALAAQIRTRIAALSSGRRAVGAEVMVEGIHRGVAPLADVAAAGLAELAGAGAFGGRAQVQAQGFIIQALGRAGGGAFDERAVRGADFGTLLRLAVALGGFEHIAGGAAYGDMAFVGRIQLVHHRQHLQRGGQLGVGEQFGGCRLIGDRCLLSHLATNFTALKTRPVSARF